MVSFWQFGTFPIFQCRSDDKSHTVFLSRYYTCFSALVARELPEGDEVSVEADILPQPTEVVEGIQAA